MSAFLQGILGVLIISIIPLVGIITLVVQKSILEKYMHLLVSFAVGALLGNAILHLIPELFEGAANPSLLGLFIIGGILLFYVLEQFLRWHHGHDSADHHHEKSIAFMNLFGDSLHNFLDGLLIAGSFMVDTRLGWATVLAVALHEIPQEIADFSILLYAKWPVKKIVLANIVSALLAFGGVIVGFLTLSTFENYVPFSLAITAGGFIYLACTDLIPDLHDYGAKETKQRFLQFVIIMLGVALFALL